MNKLEELRIAFMLNKLGLNKTKYLCEYLFFRLHRLRDDIESAEFKRYNDMFNRISYVAAKMFD